MQRFAKNFVAAGALAAAVSLAPVGARAEQFVPPVRRSDLLVCRFDLLRWDFHPVEEVRSGKRDV